MVVSISHALAQKDKCQNIQF